VLISTLRSAAESAPAFPFLITHGAERTYAQVLTDSARLASVLGERRLDRFACKLGDAVALVTLWIASAWVGAEPCVLAVDAAASEIEDLTARLGFRSIVTEEPDTAGHVPQIAAAELFARAAACEASGLTPAAAPSVLILTTGTTGRPKGVRYLWSDLNAQVHRSAEPPARWLLAYNLNHFAGVQMFLHVLVNRSSLVLPSSPKPSEALAAIEEHGLTHVSATPTFWRVLLAQLSAERAKRIPLKQITLGAEPVPTELLDQLHSRFPGARISQVFAATEVGSCVAVKDGLPGLPASILDRDESADVQFRIVEGELLIKSRHGMVGYADDDRVATPEWRSTGDLVERRGERLYFIGRKTETINVGGVKVHPLPIEERIGAVPGVDVARVYGRPNPMTGAIVAVEIVAAPDADQDAIAAAVRAACADLPAASRPRSIKFVDTVSTAGDKIVRRQT